METHLTMGDTELMINDHMKHSHRAIDDMLAQGTSILTTMKEQGLNLRSIKNKLLGIGQTVSIP